MPCLGTVKETLAALSQALGGPSADPAPLPDLREAHHELLHAGESIPRYAPANVETARVGNSANMLAVDIFRWLAA